MAILGKGSKPGLVAVGIETVNILSRIKLARWDDNRAGILELVPQGEWARRAEWFTRDTLELLDRWEVDEIDELLRLKQRVDVDKI